MNTIAFLLQRLFVDRGGVFLDNHCVTDILPGDCVTIRTNKGDFSARKVIITAGGWAPKLLKKLGVDLPLKVLIIKFAYSFKCHNGGLHVNCEMSQLCAFLTTSKELLRITHLCLFLSV